MATLSKEAIITALQDPKYPAEDVEKFAAYCIRLLLEKDRAGILKNSWMQHKTADDLATLYKRVAKDGLTFDGQHVTLQSTGVSYDYIAYKNKMFLSYPESTIDVSLVFKGDKFTFKKDSGNVQYVHELSDPFSETKEMVGAYCVIRNKRGDFLTILTEKEIEKHRKVARTDSIWRDWFNEMALKTVIKKACKQHFSDVFQNMETVDNESSNLELPVDADLAWKQEIEAIDTIEALKDYYTANKGRGKEFDKLVSLRKAELTQQNADIQITDPGDAGVAPSAEGKADRVKRPSNRKPKSRA